jgi:hypothetical protein
MGLVSLMSISHAISAAVGAFIGVSVMIAIHPVVLLPASRHPVELTDAQRATKSLRKPVPPLTILLRFVDRETYAKETSADTAAFTNPYGDICTITIPAGWMIDFSPARGFAKWLDVLNEDIFPHEILHCIVGDWHPDWSKIPEAIQRADPDVFDDNGKVIVSEGRK